ncbi:hypothetical protein NDU88_000805 [Pleurodeles waltl]|uniref:Uncharacterized protein n=1 Tax=Pleurodeles waltl TaxID=8319 RepID=A0AAV7VUK6_PLEWA|nr:hypothetical protein NDU88_000805 [Pleurodeles waltl]
MDGRSAMLLANSESEALPLDELELQCTLQFLSNVVVVSAACWPGRACRGKGALIVLCCAADHCLRTLSLWGRVLGSQFSLLSSIADKDWDQFGYTSHQAEHTGSQPLRNSSPVHAMGGRRPPTPPCTARCQSQGLVAGYLIPGLNIVWYRWHRQAPFPQRCLLVRLMKWGF